MFVSTFCIFFYLPGNVYCFWLQNMHVNLLIYFEVGDDGYGDNI